METKNVAFIFPGQGSQEVGMGLEFYRSSSRGRRVFQEADDVLGFPLSKLCFEGPEVELRQTVNAQPAILTVSVACLRTLSEAGLDEGMVSPRFVAGHSLGEYTALIAAGVLDFPSALQLVRERGRLMQEAGIRRPGGMAAILGLDEFTLEEICQQTGTDIGNVNSQEQIVISGSKEALTRAMDLCKARGARKAIPLEVSGAFHSRLMESARQGMEEAISRFSFRDPGVPIVANCTGSPMISAGAVKEELITQLCNRVRWHHSMQYMVRVGVSTFMEIGPGKVLSGLAKRISQGVEALNLGDMQSINNTRSLLRPAVS